MVPASSSDGCPSGPILLGHRLACVFTTSGLYLKLHLKVFHSTEYLSLLNSPSHIFFIKQAPKTTNLPVALKVSVYKPLETVCNSLITFSKEVTDYRYTNKCHIRCLSPSNKILTQGRGRRAGGPGVCPRPSPMGEGRAALGDLRIWFFFCLCLSVATHICPLKGKIGIEDQPVSTCNLPRLALM